MEITTIGLDLAKSIFQVHAIDAIRRARTAPESVDQRIVAMLARKPARVVTVAAANRAARVAWSIMARGGVYRAPTGAIVA